MFLELNAHLLVHSILVALERANGSIYANGGEVQRCYGRYKCFSIAFPYNFKRPQNYFPMTPEAMAVRYPIFTRRNRRTPVYLKTNDPDSLKNININPAGPFYFISHGFLEGGDKPWIQDMTNALLNVEGNDDASVIVVDWQGGSQPPYGQAVANIRLIGVITAHLIMDIKNALGLKDLDNFHFIGHSLGAHLAGYCGYHLRRHYQIVLGRITGLDPAGPHFIDTVSLVHLNKGDANFVDIIHTHAKPLIQSGLGMKEAIGHVDFYPNGGMVQPGCGSPVGLGLAADITPALSAMVGCHHVRSHEFFTESIAPSCPFIGVQCDSYENYLAGKCATCDQKHACLPMGYYSYHKYRALQDQGFNLEGHNTTLYLITGGQKPFCRSQYKVTVQVSKAPVGIHKHKPESGRVSIILVDRNGNMTEPKFVDEKQKYYKPGDLETKIIAVKDKGLPPKSIIAEWKYETNLFNPMTWRLLKTPSLQVDYIKISSIEYNTDITVCPMLKRPVVASIPIKMKPSFCSFN